MDDDRKRILLVKYPTGPFASQYVPLSENMNDRETPVETARKLISEKTHLDFFFLGHNPSMPMVLDDQSVRIFPPLHVQVTYIDKKTDYVDYVYLAQARVSPDFKEGGPMCWFHQSNLVSSPSHVKNLVRYILTLMN